MAYEQVLLEKDGPAAIITLNRPEKLNAFTNQLGRELADAIRACDADDDVRGIIITGAGRHFCAGADISDGADAFDTKSGSGAKNFGTSEPGKSRDGAGFIGAMYACQKPLIAAFNGAAVGVGITMMLPTDIKIASEKAKFGFVFAQLAPVSFISFTLFAMSFAELNVPPVGFWHVKQSFSFALWRRAQCSQK